MDFFFSGSSTAALTDWNIVQIKRQNTVRRPLRLSATTRHNGPRANSTAAAALCTLNDCLEQ